jgi:hypothetical protein
MDILVVAPTSCSGFHVEEPATRRHSHRKVMPVYVPRAASATALQIRDDAISSNAG